MKKSGILVEKFDLNSQSRPIWAWLKLDLISKLNGLDYQPVLRKGAHASRPDSKRAAEIEPETST